MSDPSSTPVATCPKCGKTIPPDHPYAWCSGCGEQLPAAIQAQLPRLRASAVQAVAARSTPAAKAAEPFLADEAEAIARLYRRLILRVGAQILLGVFLQNLQRATSAGVSLLLSLVALGMAVAVIWVTVSIVITTYRLAGRLRAGVPILWAIALFIPCVNILGLLALSGIAQSWCRRHGIKVGFFGPTQESIEELRRHSATSAFD